MDNLIEKKRVIEFLKMEYRVRTFIEEETGKKLNKSVSEAAKDGTLIEFFNSVCPGKNIKYNKNPRETYAKIDNVGIFNRALLEIFGFSFIVFSDF